MSRVEQIAQPLVAGERLSREEFLRRWELLPHIKKAELIGGVVYMPSPVSVGHFYEDALVAFWLVYYARFTPGCKAGSNGTWLMLGDASQPDSALTILPECGGQSRLQDVYLEGAPELAAEVCASSTSYDLGPKLRPYQAAGVQEYIAVLLEESRVTWHRLLGGRYSIIEPDPDGIFRSTVFPGLWLDPRALLDEAAARILEVEDQGVKSPEHEQFVQALAKHKR